MSVHAGQILHIGGLNLIDRLQAAGLGTAKVPIDTVREVGNPLVIDQVPQEPSFQFTMESFDVTTELEALVVGKVGSGPGPNQGPGATDPDGTEYKWSAGQFINILSAWKAGLSSAGTIAAGHLVPGFYPTKCSYKFGITASASQTLQLDGGAFYYGKGAPLEDYFTGDGATTAFLSTQPAVPYRVGGAGGATFLSVVGVIVDGVLQVSGIDYTESPANVDDPGVCTVTFTTAPINGAKIKFCYVTTTAQAWPDTDHAAVSTKPAAVRGRHICVYLGSGGALARVGSIQTFQLDASVTFQLERELCQVDSTGITINGYDCTGNMVVRARDTNQFFSVLSKVTGIETDELFGWLNTNPIPLTVQILNPKNPSQVLKTLYVKDAIFQPPGTESKVNTATDWTYEFTSQSGDYSTFKGAFTP